MMAFERMVMLYTSCGLTYGALRKLTTINQLTVRCNDDSKKTRPLLFVEKATVVVGHSVVNSFYFPFYMINDLSWLECKARGIDAKSAGCDRVVENLSTWEAILN